MTTTSSERKVGEVIRVEWDKETGDVRIVLDILDPAFKLRVLHNRDFEDMLVIKGKDAMIVASRNIEDKK
jgi:hypothetical protein